MISEPFPVLNAQILKTLGFALFQERPGAQEFIVLTSYVDFCDYFLAISVDSCGHSLRNMAAGCAVMDLDGI